MISIKDKEKFESKINKQENDCWIWKGKKILDGYGRLCLNGKNFYAHRLSYEIYKGEIPKGMFVCHTCDVRDCVNPDHLWIGTNLDNINDAIKKGKMPILTKGFNDLEIIQKSRDKRIGQKRSEESKQKMRFAQLGKKQTEETKIKRSKALKGRLRDEETKQKIRNKLLGHKVSEETKLKIKESLKNISEETRQKMRDSRNKFLAKEKK